MKPRLKAALVVGLTLLAAPALADQYVGVIKRSAGEVRIERDGVLLAPSRGLEVKRGDQVITGADGYALVALRTAPSVSIGPDSEVVLDRFVPPEVPAERATGLLQRLTSFLTINRHRN